MLLSCRKFPWMGVLSPRVHGHCCKTLGAGLGILNIIVDLGLSVHLSLSLSLSLCRIISPFGKVALSKCGMDTLSL